jgi:hypothetical protein
MGQGVTDVLKRGVGVALYLGSGQAQDTVAAGFQEILALAVA